MTESSDLKQKINSFSLDNHLPEFILRYSVLTSLLLIAFFTFSEYLDFKHIIEYRYFNLFFMVIGVVWGLWHFHASDETRRTNYLNGIALGISISFLASLIFSIYLYLNMKLIAPEFGLQVQRAVDFPGISVEILALISLVEGTMSGLMISFIGMQYFKNVD